MTVTSQLKLNGHGDCDRRDHGGLLRGSENRHRHGYGRGRGRPLAARARQHSGCDRCKA
jgi:hypothetical protein